MKKRAKMQLLYIGNGQRRKDGQKQENRNFLYTVCHLIPTLVGSSSRSKRGDWRSVLSACRKLSTQTPPRALTAQCLAISVTGWCDRNPYCYLYLQIHHHPWHLRLVRDSGDNRCVDIILCFYLSPRCKYSFCCCPQGKDTVSCTNNPRYCYLSM